MSNANADLDRWEAIAREHGGTIAFLRSTEVDEDGEDQFEPMLLLIGKEDGALALHFYGIDGEKRFHFLVRSDGFEGARRDELQG